MPITIAVYIGFFPVKNRYPLADLFNLEPSPHQGSEGTILIEIQVTDDPHVAAGLIPDEIPHD